MSNRKEMCHTAECCCVCKNQIELFKHPLNEKIKGSINESTGIYGCILLYNMDNVQKGILFEQKHGSCEMHVPK